MRKLFNRANGLFTILENHGAMIAALQKGKIRIVSEGETSYFDIQGGVVEVIKNKVQILAE